MTTVEIPLRGAGGEPVDLWRTLNSHGFSELSPMLLDEGARTLAFTVPVAGGKPRRVVVSQSLRRIVRVDILGRRPSVHAADAVADGVRRVLRLDADLSSFYAKAKDDPDLAWAAAGAGRMLRSPTVFEDVVKTICTTNCSWGLTTKMVNALVSELGEPAVGGDGPLTNAFPTPDAVAAQPERFFREVVRAGYRAPHFPNLARTIVSGDLDLESLAASDLPEDEIGSRLLQLPGVGPYAAAHIMMTIGRHSRLILDSWTRPKYAKLAGGKKQPSDAQIERRFRSYGEHAGLAFWLFVTRDWVS